MTVITAPLPLRTTSVWGAFREAEVIPHRYGDTSGAAVQYDDLRTRFVWSDHATQAIDAVKVGGQEVSNWIWANEVDSTGRPVAVITFAQPIDEGADVVAVGRGKLHPNAGRPMTNPADVVWDVLANIAGRPVTESSIEAFRRACDAAELVVGGSIAKADTALAVVRSVCASVGAIFCPDMQGLCALWPTAEQGPSRWKVAEGKVSSAAAADDLANDITIQYGHSDGEPRAAMRLDAPDMIALYGSATTVIDAPWVNSARVAESVGTRILQHRSRPQWTVTAPVPRMLSVGDVITLAHPKLPASGPCMVLARESNLDSTTAGCEITVKAPAGDVPRVRIVSQSSAFEPAQYATALVSTQGNDRIITLLDDKPGSPPLAGAKVTLDGGSMIRFTDAAGRVSFPASSMPVGPHTLTALTADGRTINFGIEIQ